MWLKSIELLNYKTHAAYKQAFTWGYNEIQEANEFGKSTLLEGIEDVLKTPARSAARALREKRTLGAADDPVLRLTVVVGEQEYLLERNGQDNTSSARGVGVDQDVRSFLDERYGGTFSFLGAHLLVLRERDLRVRSDSDGFKSIFDEVLKTRDIGEVVRGVGRCLGTRGLKGALGRRVAEWHAELALRMEQLRHAEAQVRDHAAQTHALAAARRDLQAAGKQLAAVDRDLEEIDTVTRYRFAAGAARAEVAGREAAAGIQATLAKAQVAAAAADDSLQAALVDGSRCQGEQRQLEAAGAGRDAVAGALRAATAEREREAARQGRVRELEGALAALPSGDPVAVRALLSQWENLQTSQRLRVTLDSAAADVQLNGQLADSGWFDPPLRIDSSALQARVDIELGPAESAEENRADVEARVAAYGGADGLRSALALAEELARSRQAPGTDELEQAATRVAELAAQLRRIDAAQVELAAAMAATAAAEARASDAQQAATQAARRLATAEAELAAAARELQRRAEEATAAQQFLSEYDLLAHGVVRAFESLSGAALQERREAGEQTAAIARQRRDELGHEVARLEGRTQSVPDTDTLESLRRDVDRLEHVVQRAREWEELLPVASQLASGLSARMEAQYLADTQQQMSELFSSLTGGEYRRLRFDTSSLFTSDLLSTLRAGHSSLHEYAFADLSDGTKVQATLALRLALLQSAVPPAAGAERFFLVFDEPFAYFDATRELQARELLHRLVDRGWQVIVLSCKVAAASGAR